MLVPLGTDRPMRRKPRTCEALLAVTLAAYVLVMLVGLSDPARASGLIDMLSLQRGDLSTAPWTLLSYQFAHDSPFAGSPDGGSGLYRLLHLGFNMLGLWVFGRPLEDRIGHLPMAALYLAGGMLGGLAHIATSMAPVIGASGSVCALVGGFAMLLPRVNIRILVIFILIGIWSVPATWVIAFWMSLDLIGFAGATAGNTAFAAHLGGYGAGLVLGLCFLLLKRTTGDDVDALWLFRQWRRRSKGRAALASKPPAVVRQPVVQGAAPDTPEAEVILHIAWLREVEVAMQHSRRKGALQKWKREAPASPEACLPPAIQLDLANQLQADGDYTEAADAYARLLEHAPNHREAPMVRLLLGVLLARRLQRFDDAKPLLQQAAGELDDSNYIQLAQQVLQESPS